MENYIHIDQVKESRLFYMFPKWLLGPEYRKLSDRSKLFYMYFWDRVSLSEENKWYDGEGRVYIYSTIDELENVFDCSKPTVINAKKELTSFGLIEEVRQGVNKPNRIYVLGSKKTLPQEVKNFDLGSKKSLPQEVKNFDPINTEFIKTEFIKTESSRLNNSTAVGGENNRQTTLIGADLSQSIGRPIGWSGIQSYLESQSLALSPKQISELEDFMEIDGLEKSLIEKAIDIAAGETGSKRSYKYLKGILTNWKNGNIKTVADQEANEAEREKTPKRIFKNKRLQEKWDNYDDSNDLF